MRHFGMGRSRTFLPGTLLMCLSATTFLLIAWNSSSPASLPLTEETFRSLDWNLLDEEGQVVAALFRPRANGTPYGLKGKFEFQEQGIKVTLPQPVQFSDARLEGGRTVFTGKGEDGKVYALRQRMPQQEKIPYLLAITCTFGACYLFAAPRLSKKASLYECLCLCAIVFLVLFLYTRVAFSTNFDLARWMRETAYRHVHNGLAYTKGLDVNSNAPAPLSFGVLGGHHPPGLGLLLAGLYVLTGSTRDDVLFIWLVPLFFHGLGACSFFLLMRKLWGPERAVFALACYLFLPMSIYQGRVASHEAPTMGLCMTGLFCVYQYLHHFRRRWFAGAILFLGSACFFGWPAFFYCAAVGLSVLLVSYAPLPRRSLLFLSIGCASSVILLLLVLQHKLLLGTIDELLQASSRRIGSGGLEEFKYQPYTWSQWADAVLNMARIQGFGTGVLVLVVIGMALLARSWPMGAFNDTAWIFCVLLIVGLFHLVLFHFGSYVHEYWTFYLIPPMAMTLSAIPYEAFRPAAVQRSCCLAVLLVIFYYVQTILPSRGVL